MKEAVRVFKIISVEMEGRDLLAVHEEVSSLMTGSLECVGGGMMIGSTVRDIEIEADSKKEIVAFEKLLVNKGYKIVK